MYHASLSQDKTLAHIIFSPEKDDKIQLVLWSLELVSDFLNDISLTVAVGKEFGIAEG